MHEHARLLLPVLVTIELGLRFHVCDPTFQILKKIEQKLRSLSQMNGTVDMDTDPKTRTRHTHFISAQCHALSNYGRRAFSFAGPYYWNSLPDNVRNSVSIASFKRALKTFLFC